MKPGRQAGLVKSIVVSDGKANVAPTQVTPVAATERKVRLMGKQSLFRQEVLHGRVPAIVRRTDASVDLWRRIYSALFERI